MFALSCGKIDLVIKMKCLPKWKRYLAQTRKEVRKFLS
jgi:hypothetical protein